MFILTSPVLEDNGIFPEKFTSAKGKNISPPLKWSGAPADTKSYALTLIDPNVPWGQYGLPKPGFAEGDLYIHWAAFNIPATVKSLPEAVSPKDKLPKGMEEVTNTCGDFPVGSDFYKFRQGYFGSWPPTRDKAHRYIFTLYAVNKAKLNLPKHARHPGLLNALAGNVIGRASFQVYFGVKA